MPKTNVVYNSINVLTSVITICEGYLSENKIVWNGRVISIDRDLYGNKKITCEGDLARFADYYEDTFDKHKSDKTDYVWSGNVGVFWTNLIQHYNATIPFDAYGNSIASKAVYNFGVSDSIKNKMLSIEEKSFISGIDLIQNELLEKVGGFVWCTWTLVDGIPRMIVHHDASSGEWINQDILFGENMIDITDCINGTDVFTGIIAEGANDDNGNPVTLSSVPSADSNEYFINNKRLYSRTAIGLFGRIEAYEKFDSAGDASALYTLAKDKLSRALAESMSITVSAVDLNHIDTKKSKLWVGKMVRCASKEHGLDAVFRITSMSITLDDPSGESYTLGLPKPSMCVQQNVTKSKAKKVEKNAVTVKNSNKKTGNVSTTTNSGCINLGDEVVIAYGTVQTQSVGTKANFTVNYSNAGFKNVPTLVAVPGCSADAGTVSGVGATIGTHIKAISKTGATVQVTKTGGTNNVGVLWIAIGY